MGSLLARYRELVLSTPVDYIDDNNFERCCGISHEVSIQHVESQYIGCRIGEIMSP